MPEIRRVRLPDHYYLSRTTYSGLIVHDQVPWEEGVAYVTDGTRYGVEMKDGSVLWMEEDPVERFADDFAGVDIDLAALLSGLRQYAAYRWKLSGAWFSLDGWERDLAALEAVQARNGREESPSPYPPASSAARRSASHASSAHRTRTG